MIRSAFLLLPLAACVVDDPTVASTESDVQSGSPVPATQLLSVLEVSVGDSGCSGTLIAPNKVLTAGHCFCSDSHGTTACTNNGLVTVLFRANPFVPGQDPSTRYRHGHGVVHPGYAAGFEGIEHDLAIVTIEDKPSYIPAMSVSASTPPDRTWVVDTGFGFTKSDCSGPAGTLTHEAMPIVGHDGADTVFFDNDDVLCHGDSGGPALDFATQTQLLAVNSGTWFSFAHGGRIDKLAATGPNYTWIAQNTCGSSPCGGNGPLCRCPETSWVPVAGAFVGSTGNLYIANHVGGGEFCSPATDGASISRTSKDTAQAPNVLYKAADCLHDFVAIARDGTYAVVLDAGRKTVSRIPLAGGALVDLATTAAVSTGGATLAVDAGVSPSRVYWADAAGIKTVSMNGGPATTLVPFTGGFTTGAIGIDMTYVYYTAGNVIRRVPKAGGPATDRVTTNNADALFVAGNDQIYWTEHAPFKVRSQIGFGVTDLYIGDNSRQATSIYFDGTFAYVTDYANGGTDYRLHRIHPDVRMLDPIPTGNILGAHHLEIDATRAWWVDTTGIKKTIK
jgi:hypothetical protein